MLALWRPWEGKAATRTLSITGEASITATPDEFHFSPSYVAKGTDVEKLKADIDAKVNQVFKDIKALGVDESDITIDSSSYKDYYYEEQNNSEQTVSSYVQVTAKSKELAQKVQNYLATSGAEGQLTSQPTFSREKAKRLEDDGREKAIKDAHTKAETAARNLNVRVGKVISFKDQTNQPYYALDSIANSDSAGKARESVPVTPGKQDTSYSVEVVFELY